MSDWDEGKERELPPKVREWVQAATTQPISAYALAQVPPELAGMVRAGARVIYASVLEGLRSEDEIRFRPQLPAALVDLVRSLAVVVALREDMVGTQWSADDWQLVTEAVQAVDRLKLPEFLEGIDAASYEVAVRKAAETAITLSEERAFRRPEDGDSIF